MEHIYVIQCDEIDDFIKKVKEAPCFYKKFKVRIMDDSEEIETINIEDELVLFLNEKAGGGEPIRFPLHQLASLLLWGKTFLFQEFFSNTLEACK